MPVLHIFHYLAPRNRQMWKFTHSQTWISVSDISCSSQISRKYTSPNILKGINRKATTTKFAKRYSSTPWTNYLVTLDIYIFRMEKLCNTERTWVNNHSVRGVFISWLHRHQQEERQHSISHICIDSYWYIAGYDHKFVLVKKENANHYSTWATHESERRRIRMQARTQKWSEEHL